MSFILEVLQKRFPTLTITTDGTEEALRVPRERVPEIFNFLRQEPTLDFQMLLDLTVVDFQPRTPRFEVVYHLLSLSQNRRIRIKTTVPEEDPQVPSLTTIWPGANWLEREAWDMFGIVFSGHPNLERILMYEEFQGHPLRKDYPYRKRQPLVGPQDT